MRLGRDWVLFLGDDGLNYRITQGPDTNFDDQGDGPGSVLLHDFDHKGDFVDLTLPPDTPTVIDLVQLSAIGDPAPQLDLGLSEDLFRLEGAFSQINRRISSPDQDGAARNVPMQAPPKRRIF